MEVYVVCCDTWDDISECYLQSTSVVGVYSSEELAKECVKSSPNPERLEDITEDFIDDDGRRNVTLCDYIHVVTYIEPYELNEKREL